MTGYRKLVASDPQEQELRSACHAAADAGDVLALGTLQARLSTYLWKRTQDEIAADRAKHPKAKRNQVFQGPQGEGRNLP